MNPCLATLLSLLLCASATHAQEMTATFVEGEVSAAPGGPVSVGMPLHAGQEIVTGPGARFEVTLQSGTVIRLGGDSRLTLQAEVPHKSFSARLSLGNLWAKVHKLLVGETFQIETENGVAGVRGTEFRVEVEQGHADLLRVYEGVVQVDGRGGGFSERIEPGRELRFERGHKPSVQAFDPASEKEHGFMAWVRSRPTKEDATPGKIHHFHNPEQERREREKEHPRRHER